MNTNWNTLKFTHLKNNQQQEIIHPAVGYIYEPFSYFQNYIYINDSLTNEILFDECVEYLIFYNLDDSSNVMNTAPVYFTGGVINSDQYTTTAYTDNYIYLNIDGEVFFNTELYVYEENGIFYITCFSLEKFVFIKIGSDGLIFSGDLAITEADTEHFIEDAQDTYFDLVNNFNSVSGYFSGKFTDQSKFSGYIKFQKY